MPSKGTVKLGRSFFVKERDQMYANWPFAFWRELFQNSTDANASHIHVTIEQNGRIASITFNDDGIGMSLDTLVNVYFNLGATTKDDSTTVGGFGRARILTNFSMLWYTIRTQDIEVRGEGADYEIAEKDDYIDGCHMTIGVDAPADEMTRELKRYLSYSQMVCQVFINGTMWTDWGLKNRFVRNLEVDGEPFAAVHVSDEGFAGWAIVRVNGTTMFTDRIRAKAQVVIEIEPAISRLVLTGNRDGFQSRYADAVRAFLNEIAVNTKSSLRTRRRERWEILPGDGPFYSVHKNALDRSDMTNPKTHNPDIYLLIDTDDQAVLRHLPGCRERKQADGLLRSWMAICDEVINKMLPAAHLTHLRWAVGWMFTDDPTQRAKYAQMDDVAVFLLNPLRIDGKRVLARRDLQDLVASAKHEVAHVISPDHDESFANVLSQIDSAVVFKTIARERHTTEKVARTYVNGTMPSMSGRQRRVLMYLFDYGRCTRNACADVLWQLVDDEAMYGRRRQGQVHWAHPAIDNMRLAGLIEPVGNVGKEIVYDLTELGRRACQRFYADPEMQTDATFVVYYRARDWWDRTARGEVVPVPAGTFRCGPHPSDLVEEIYNKMLGKPELSELVDRDRFRAMRERLAQSVPLI